MYNIKVANIAVVKLGDVKLTTIPVVKAAKRFAVITVIVQKENEELCCAFNNYSYLSSMRYKYQIVSPAGFLYHF